MNVTLEGGHQLEVWQCLEGQCSNVVRVLWCGALKVYQKGLGELCQTCEFWYGSLGESSRIRLWFDIWCGDWPLINVFPAIFCLAAYQFTNVLDLLYSSNGVIKWDICLS